MKSLEQTGGRIKSEGKRRMRDEYKNSERMYWA